jgi:S1-C subfamily serine protease
MLPRLLRPALAAVALTTCVAAPARAQDIKATARSLVEKKQNAVLTVKLVVRITMVGPGGGRDQDQKVEVTGTTIDPSGLTVVSASAIDPGAMLKQLLSGMPGGEEGGMKIESEVNETALVLDDGTEVEADVVLKDPELDLAFVKPHATDKKFESIALKPRGTPPQLLEDFFVVSRLGRNASRAIAVTLGRVKATVKGPKTYTITDHEVAQTNLGCVAFDASGATLGILVSKTAKSLDTEGEMGMMSLFMGGGGRPTMTILRPIEDVLELAEQAKNAKPPEKKAKKTTEKKGDDEDEDAPKKPAKKDDGAKPDDKKDDKKKDE